MAKKATADQQKAPKGYVPALKKLYKEEIVAKLVEEFSFNTVMEAPRLVKITINEGIGEGTQDKKIVEDAAEELALITGQKAVITTSRKDISNVNLVDANGKATKVAHKEVDGKKVRIAKTTGEEIK
jgi:large subunit ribosomal protein L5